jgi:hypothetical protein
MVYWRGARSIPYVRFALVRTLRCIALSLIAAGVLVVPTGCSGSAGDGTADATPSSVAGRASAIVRSGWFDASRTNEARFRVQIDRVSRDARRTVLQLSVTNLESGAQVGIDRFGASSSDTSFAGFQLLDAVGGKLYSGYRQDNADGLGYGSRLHEVQLQPGVHYSAVVYFPPLPETAKQIAAGGDPSQPITVIGHTDAIGSTADNQTLSVRRATAVEAELRATLDGSRRYSVAGKGESEPIAEERQPDGSDNPEGRARNRRVEVSYPRRPAAGPSGAAGPATAAGDGSPAPFRADNFRSPSFPGPTYASFSVIDPANAATYRTAEVTVNQVKRYLDGHVYARSTAEPQRVYMYIPAPPPGITSVTFDAGPFGKIDNVPVS